MAAFFRFCSAQSRAARWPTSEDLRCERPIRSGMNGQPGSRHRSRHGRVPRPQRPFPNILPRSSARRYRKRDEPDLVSRRQPPPVRAPSTSTAPPLLASTSCNPAPESHPANQNKMILFVADIWNWESMPFCRDVCCGRHCAALFCRVAGGGPDRTGAIGIRAGCASARHGIAIPALFRPG